MNRIFLMIAFVLGSGVSAFSHEFATDGEIPYSYEQVYHFAYEGTPAYPPGFYQETHSASPFDTRYQVNTVSIVPSAERKDERWSELCSDDAEQARQWMIATVANFSEKSTFVTFQENGKFFEGEWTRDSGQSFFPRVFKCQWLDRSLHDNLKPRAVLGELGSFPVQKAHFKDVVEYLVYRETNGVGGSKVLAASEIEDLGKYFSYSILTLQISYGDWKAHDSIQILRTEYWVDKSVGTLIQVRSVGKNYEGKKR